MFNQYFMDKLLLAYFHKCPPYYDARIGNHVYRLMKYAGFAGFGFAYWALGNPAMFSNYVVPKTVM